MDKLINVIKTGLKFVLVLFHLLIIVSLLLRFILLSLLSAIQETKIDSSISSSELFPETSPYSVYRKDRTLDGAGVMLLIHKDIPHMPITELENKSESVWVKVFANKTAHFVASWYRPPHRAEAMRTTVVPISGVIRTTVVPISGIIGPTVVRIANATGIGYRHDGSILSDKLTYALNYQFVIK